MSQSGACAAPALFSAPPAPRISSTMASPTSSTCSFPCGRGSSVSPSPRSVSCVPPTAEPWRRFRFPPASSPNAGARRASSPRARPPLPSASSPPDSPEATWPSSAASSPPDSVRASSIRCRPPSCPTPTMTVDGGPPSAPTISPVTSARSRCPPRWPSPCRGWAGAARWRASRPSAWPPPSSCSSPSPISRSATRPSP